MYVLLSQILILCFVFSLHSCFDVRSTLQCPNEAFIDAETADTMHETRDSDEDAANTSCLSHGSDQDYDDGDFWSDVEEGSTEERRGNTRGLLAPRPNHKSDLGLTNRAAHGVAKERHTKNHVRWIDVFWGSNYLMI